MANDAVISHRCVGVWSGVDDGAVLNTRALSDDDFTFVAPQDSTGPDRRVGTDCDRPDDYRVGMDEC